MDYLAWRDEIFNTPPDTDPVFWELSPPLFALSQTQTLDLINQTLLDVDILQTYSKEKIGNGMQLLYNNACSHFPFSYLEAPQESERVQAIAQLKFLYQNYFDPLCQSPVTQVGHHLDDGSIGYLCYMFWDIFVLYPGSAAVTPKMIDAALDVMVDALTYANDHLIISALHGLGHWGYDVPEAKKIISRWLQYPTTNHPAVLTYGNQAWSGCIQ